MRTEMALIEECIHEIKVIRLIVLPEKQETLIKAEVQRINGYMAKINKHLKFKSCEEEEAGTENVVGEATEKDVHLEEVERKEVIKSVEEE